MVVRIWDVEVVGSNPITLTWRKMYIDDNDRKQIEALKKIVQPDWTFADVGVCQGAMLLPMSRMMKFGWGFEAKPST